MPNRQTHIIHHLCRTIIFVIPDFAEPPTSVTIMDFSGQELEENRAGPYSLDSILSLTCVSSGGNMAWQIFSFFGGMSLIPTGLKGR